MSRMLIVPMVLLALHSPAGPVRADGGFGADAGEFRITYYWIAFERDHRGPRTVALIDCEGATLATVADSFAREISLEGTGVLEDGRVLNLRAEHPAAAYGWCFFEVDRGEAPWGWGSNAPLHPFRSLAENGHLPPGQTVFLPDFVGIPIPAADGGIDLHDGCFVVEDTGYTLGERHVDMFVLAEAHYRKVQRLIGGKDAVRIYTDSPLCPPAAEFLYRPDTWARELVRQAARSHRLRVEPRDGEQP
ncbi:MAG: hypothetical protein FJ098_00910 [Deltaproteobacteria bacterium]|nr:hypothetical protein [Deltaproteobacteria bacterium]